MKVVFVGSGAFGVPTLRALAEASSHELVGVLTKPGKPAGRGQKIRQTPVFDAATEYDLDLAAPNSINDDSGQEWLDQKSPDALVVIAYERLLTKRVLSGRFACNLHASLLPRWRGAAPIHRAVLAGDQDIECFGHRTGIFHGHGSGVRQKKCSEGSTVDDGRVA